MAFQWDKGEFRVFDSERGWEFIWEGGSDPELLYRLEHDSGKSARLSVRRLSESEVEVLMLSCANEIEGLKALIIEALNAYGRPLSVSFVEN